MKKSSANGWPVVSSPIRPQKHKCDLDPGFIDISGVRSLLPSFVEFFRDAGESVYLPNCLRMAPRETSGVEAWLEEVA